jgi:hypothetical protein
VDGSTFVGADDAHAERAHSRANFNAFHGGARSRRVVRKGTHVNRSSSTFSLVSGVRGMKVAALFAALLVASACSSTSSSAPFGDGSGDDDGTDGGSSGSDGSTASDGSAAHDSSAPDASTGVDSSSAADTAPPMPDTGTVTSDDGFSAARTACINEINRLRATQSLPPYTLVNTDSVNTCVDGQATSDEAANVAHQAWESGADSCNGNGQDECEGYGNDVNGITSCLDDMWAEKDNSDCAGCVGCQNENGCANCNFSGTGGQPECGHYVNMSAVWFTSVACGFATAPGTWSAQNFFQ